jgi:PEP-CTERM motif
MKKLILAAFALTTAASVFAQGTVILNNYVPGSVVQHVYAPLATAPGFSQIGSGAGDTPASNNVWTAFTLVGGAGATGNFTAANANKIWVQLLAAPGANQAESSLQPAPGITSFRTAGGAQAGFTFAGVTSTLNNVAADALATVELVAWDNNNGLYPTWTQASLAWRTGLITAGESGRWNTVVGGTGTPPYLTGAQAFNLYSLVPEPSTFTLAGLGLAALVAFRRRSK